MPIYDYECAVHGAFAALRPIDARNSPCACPSCGAACGRGAIAAPMLAALPASARTAQARNERAAHAPLHSTQANRAHGAACSCCRPNARRAQLTPDGSKTFPSARPWQLSH